MRAAVFLARDGALLAENNTDAISAPVLAKGSASAVASICGLGYRVVMLAPQTGDDGRRDAEIGRLIEEASNGARIDQVCRYNTLTPTGRKKKARLAESVSLALEQIASDLNIDIPRSWLIGVNEDQIEAGTLQGLRTILLDPHAEGIVPPASEGGIAPAYLSGNLVEAVRIVAQQRKPEVQEEIHKAELGGRRWDTAAVARIQRAREEPLAPKDLAAASAQAVSNTPATSPEVPAPTTAAIPESTPAPQPPQISKPPKPAATPEPKPVAAKARNAENSRSSVDSPHTSEARLLKQILSEIRSHRPVSTGIAPLHMLAMILQLIAAICLIGGLWMAASDTDLLLRWAFGGIMVQLAAITALLLHERSA
ncbi:hypothetical protein [Mucisphaera sp.]|uniref:hypothetical protein n=1 Tax=Mucisphaera sp. TaxID=2913024 RepID=UPI003D13AF15